jgi:hypothetical protein
MHDNAAHSEQLAIRSGEGAMPQVRSMRACLAWSFFGRMEVQLVCKNACGGDVQGLKARVGLCR